MNQFGRSLAHLYTELFRTVDRKLASWGILLNIIALLLTILLEAVPKPGFVVIRDLLIFFALLFMFLFFLVKYIRREATVQSYEQLLARQRESHKELQEQYDTLERQLTVQMQQQLSQQLRNAYDLVHAYKDVLFKGYFNQSLNDHIYRLTSDEKDLFNTLCMHVTLDIKKSFQQQLQSRGIQIGDDISVSVKMIIPTAEVLDRFSRLSDAKKRQLQQKDKWITTTFRDPDTHVRHKEREKGQRIYDIANNTAFRDIIDYEIDHFVRNDLQYLFSIGAYRNENPEWAKHYNATAVVPIRYKHDHAGICKIYGLLAVDSPNKQKVELFDDGSVILLSHAADLLATFFLLVELLAQYRSGEGRPAASGFAGQR